VERVSADRIVQRGKIPEEIRINPRRICRGKTGGIEKNVVADIVEVAADSPLAPVTVHRFSKIESKSSISIACCGACSLFVVSIFACSRARFDRSGRNARD
jgi:hypothetical protein